MKDILNSLHQLPAMPAVVQELIQSFDNPALDSHRLAEKISRDPALAARVLHVANSAFYGLPRQVGSIHEAVVVLGFGTVRSLVLTAGIIGTFDHAAPGCLDRRRHWRRALVSAVFARALAHCLRQEAETAYSAGLLHEIGLMVLDVCAPDRLAPLWQAGEDGLIEAERAALGFDHAELGAEVAQRWKFPAAIEEAIRYHYQPEHRPLAALVQAARALARAWEDGLPRAEWAARTPPGTLRLEPESLERCLPQPEQLEALTGMMT